MSFNDIKAQSQREACTIFEIDLDINDPALDAEFAADPDSYGTPKTTNDFRAYKDGEFRTYRYSNQAISNLDCFPGLESSRTVPPKANPGVDIGFRATASVSLKDFTTNDAYELQGLYADRRVIGSHWAKLFARNFIKNRPARIRRGYLVDGVYDDVNFLTEHYIIDEFQGPSLTGDVDFNLVDVLALTNGINAKAPETSNATLNAAITVGEPSATINLEAGLTAQEIEDKFGANGESGTLAIDSEYIVYTVTSATGVAPVTVSLDTRAAFGTLPASHAINATVQRCIAWPTLTNIIDIITELFTDYTDIDVTYIDTANWAALKTGELAGFMLTNAIAKETEIKKLLNQLIQVAGLTIYTDVIERKIKITATPNFDLPVITFDQREHIQAGTLKINNKFDKLITRQLVSWAPQNYSSNDASNYSKTFRVAALLEEQRDRLGTKNAGPDVVTGWLPNTVNGNQIATGIAQRNVSRFSQIPTEVTLEVDTKYIDTVAGGKLWLGAVFAVETVNKVYCNGAFQPEILTCQCISVSAVNGKNDKWRVTGISYKANVPPNADYYIPAGQYFNYILSDNFDFSESREYIVVINTGATFGSTSTAWAAFRQGTFAVGATLRIINQGQQIGRGGDGGDGGQVLGEDLCQDFPGDNGLAGGAAIEFTTDAIIDNAFGLIGGGGGGGAGRPSACPETVGGNGGGGGQGLSGGIGGAGGAGIGGPAVSGQAGPNGTINAPGVELHHLDGGELGEAGESAMTGELGGAAGAAIITNGNTVTITAGNNGEQVRGPIV